MAVHDEWRKELRLLLDRIERNPSADLERERERVGVLQRLLASQENARAA